MAPGRASADATSDIAVAWAVASALALWAWDPFAMGVGMMTAAAALNAAMNAAAMSHM